MVKADGHAYEQFIQIEANPEKGFTVAALDLLYKQGMRLHALHEKLAALTDTLDKSIAVLVKMENKNDAISNKLEKLNSIRKEIIETNRKSIFFDEFKFRRKVSDLYLDVATALMPLSASQEKGIGVLEAEFEVFKTRVYDLMK